MTNTAPSNADPLLRKVLLGRYLAKRIVSATVETVTYEAADQKTGGSLRIVRPVRASGAPALDPARLREVTDALGRLRGVPGLLLPVAAGMVDSNVFLVLPTGGRQQPLVVADGHTNQGLPGSRTTVPTWLKQVADTLDVVHGRGLCHGRLSPEAVIALEDGRIAVDGLPLALVARAIGQVAQPATAQAAGWARYAAPEVIAGGMPSSAGDQYALARMVAESVTGQPGVAAKTTTGSAGALPTLPEALSRALAVDPRDRFPGCGQFVGALITGSGVPAGKGSPGIGEGPPLEMAPVLGHDDGRSGRQRPAPAEVPLELGDSFTAPRPKPKAESGFRADDEEELLDITFTKPGENLLTERGTLSKAASFGSSRSAWRRMIREFQQLSGSRKGIATALAGAGVLIVAFVVISVVWWAAVGVTNWVGSAWETARTAIQPDVGSLTKSGEQTLEKAKGLWEEWKPKDSGDGAPPDRPLTPPAKIGSTKLAGNPWPERPEDQLAEEDLAEPVAMVEQITAAKDAAPSVDGTGLVRGVFVVPDETGTTELKWVGGFGVRPKGRELKSSDSPKLDGTVCSRMEDGSTWVAEYSMDEIKQFWLIKDDQGGRLTVSARVASVKDAVVLNGAAFVLDEGVPECLALVYEEGTLVGGQWCTKVPKEEEGAPPERVAFAPPSDVVAPEKLADADSGFDRASKALAAAVEQLPAWSLEARKALRQAYKQAFK